MRPPLPDPEDAHLHRAGAWKVAYADFVTALMALFIVLWLMGAGREVRDSVSSYFRSPQGHANLSGSGVGGAGEGIHVTAENVAGLRSRLEHTIEDTPALRRIAPYVQFSVTGEGLRVELTESSEGVFFETGSPQPTGGGVRLFSLLAAELSQLPNLIVVEGHTDSSPFRTAAPDAYGNWNLSFDRANMARRLMLSSGVRPDQIAEIRGFADRRPLTPDPANSRNRRVSVVVRFR